MIEQRIRTWEKKFIQQGKLEGKLEGQAQLLRRILVRRFGLLPATVEAQIRNANLEQMEQWFDASMDAASLDAVFALH